MALDNFIAFALMRSRRWAATRPPEEDEARALFGKLDRAKTTEDMVAGAQFLRSMLNQRARSAQWDLLGGGMGNTLAYSTA